MNETGRARLKVELAQRAALRKRAVPPETIERVAAAMLAEDARLLRTRSHGRATATFIAAQARFIPAWTWAAQVLLVVLMYLITRSTESFDMIKMAVGMLSAASVLAGMPIVHASKQHGVAELEFSCRHNAASVMVARLIALGCSSALAVAAMVAMTASSVDVDALAVALWACPPFFTTCAGCLTLLRRAQPSTAVVLCAAWALSCCIALAALAAKLPDLYAQTSLAVWAAAAALALAWLAGEVACTIRAACAGLDVFTPPMAHTGN